MTTKATTGDGVPADEGRAREATVKAEHLLHVLRRTVFDLFFFLRFLPFAFYILLAIVSFWLWVVGAVISLVRFGLRAVMIVLLWLSGGIAPPPGHQPRGLTATMKRDLQQLWDSRLAAYEDIARPLARHIVGAQRGVRTFVHWSVPRQAFAVLVIGIFIGVPALFVIPRPNHVVITDDNATHHEQDGTLRYLIHARDLHNNEPLEFENEIAWWLGKLDPQGLKSSLQNGRAYRIWIVGIRWWYKPMAFPNIISATEIDLTGQPLAQPSRPPVLPAAPQ